MPPGLVVAWQAKFTTQPRQLPLASQAARTPTSGSVGPAGSRMSGLPWPGWVTALPSRILKRRSSAESELNAFLGSHRVLGVDWQLVDRGANSFWTLCVEYLPGVAGASSVRIVRC